MAVLVVTGALLALPVKADAAAIIFDQFNHVNGAGEDQLEHTAGGDWIGTQIVFETITHGTQAVYCGEPQLGGGTDTKCYLNFNTDTGEFTVDAPGGLYYIDGAMTVQTLVAGPVTVLTGTISGVATPFDDTLVLTGSDTKLAALLEFFGLDPQGGYEFVETTIKADLPPLNSTSTIDNADITNNHAVPEPGLLALFGLGLVGVGRQLARRRKN